MILMLLYIKKKCMTVYVHIKGIFFFFLKIQIKGGAFVSVDIVHIPKSFK